MKNYTRIVRAEYCALRTGRPVMVDVEAQNGEIKKCDVYLNHEFENSHDYEFETARFTPKTTPTTREPWDYQKFDFETPVASTIPNNDLAKFVREEFNRKFREQREQEGW